NQVQVAIAIPVDVVGRGDAEDIELLRTGLKLDGWGILGRLIGAFVFNEVNIAVQGAGGPFAMAVVGVVPAVVAPVTHANQEVEVAVAFPIDQVPLIGPTGVEGLFVRDFLGFGKGR